MLPRISTLKNEGENLEKNQTFDEVKGAQVQIHSYQKIWNSSCTKKYSMEKGNGRFKWDDNIQWKWMLGVKF